VFFDGNVHNYKHWWIDMLAPLDVASRRAELAGYRLLPAAIQQLCPWQQDSLRLMDHGDLFSPDSGLTVMRVDEAIWVDILDSFPFHYDELDKMRSMAVATLKQQPEPRKKVYIKRLNKLRAIRNELDVDSVLLSRGFEIAILENMSQREQIELFSQASTVIGNHGAGFANILFSGPGTKIIEFMPSVEMRVHYWGISCALDQQYGFIRCQSESSDFHGPMSVDVTHLQNLLDAFDV